MGKLERIIKHMEVAPLQNLASLLAAPFVFECSKAVLESYSTSPKWSVYFALTALLNVSAIAVNQNIAVEKFQEYKKVKQAFEKYGWDERIARTKSYSWCQRNAAKVAAKDAGFGKEVRDYFNKK